MDARLSAHLEVAALRRLVESEGGFFTIVQKGDRDAGTLLLLTTNRGRNARLWERMPQLDGSRGFTCTMTQAEENKEEFDAYVIRRGRQDPDCWIAELDIDDAERFVADVSR